MEIKAIYISDKKGTKFKKGKKYSLDFFIENRSFGDYRELVFVSNSKLKVFDKKQEAKYINLKAFLKHWKVV